ncbi:sigma-70 family RNA polymerase sigma factor [Fulvivirgaceae bacterium BMA12]|uniref:Sigma-70 family RNA polymerase sigma factor n=1 Tax=Agaribacillus aureus TaxID=3051825 RepID=A0ABT8L6C7_9BACT|nr:sigma-70 family RNA polymerase sigma factor [Fulvivirgaceae bacterium BMA12]
MNSNYHISDEQILQEQTWVEAAQKDPEKFDKLYDRYFEGIFSFVFRRTDDEGVAADITSQTFLAALQSIKKYRFKGLPFSAWLYKIAANQVNKYYRTTKKNVIFSLEESLIGKLMVETNEDTNEEQISLLVAHLKQLPTEDVMVLELRFFEEKSFKEIAYILEITESGAKMRTYRAVNKLKKIFDANLMRYEKA